MNRAVLLLVLTLAAFAGAVAYLHHRANPAARDKALQATFLEIRAHASFRDILANLLK